MPKQIQAYFTSENDATSAEASLQRFRVSNTFIETLSEPDEERIFLPIYALGANSSGLGTGGVGGAGLGGFAWVSKDVPAEADDTLEKNDQPMTHLLKVELAEDENVSDVIDVLKDNDGYMLKESDE